VKRELAQRSLLRFVPWLTSTYQPPRHLGALVERLEAMVAGKPQRLVVHAPPRHGKTELLLHFIAWVLWRRPELQMAYCSYGADITRSKSRVAMGFVQRLGVQLATENVTEWLTPQRGGLRAKSVTEGLTGHAVNLGIIDDPVKGRLQAESSRMRDRLKDWAESEFLTRLEPGASAVCTMTRWHPDDLAGWLIREKGWEELRLPALTDGDVALWPERWSPEALKTRRAEVGEYTWASLFQGVPRPRGGAVFGDPEAYEALPATYRIAIGLDFAYSKRTSSDWSVAVVMAECAGYFYVLDVLRAQQRAPEFSAALRPYRVRYPTARWRWYAAGTETGVADFLRPMLAGAGEKRPDGSAFSPVPLEVLAPHGDKFTRAIPYAAAWNARKVLLPEDAAARWVDELVAEHSSFTGVNDAHDDIIDAAVAAFDVLATAPVSFGAPGERRVLSPRRM
jgi:predicted phage terminase large subunit-like protein